MKCVRNPETGVIRRVSDELAQAYVEDGWAYCPKHVWRGVPDNKTAEAPTAPAEESKPEVKEAVDGGRKNRKRSKKRSKH